MKKIKIIALAAVLIAIVSVYSHFFQTNDMALAGASDNLSGFAWSDNIGWISFNSSDCDIDNDGIMDRTNVGSGSGDSSAPVVCPIDGTSIPNYGVNVNTSGTMSGFAWSDNIGWIDFGPTSGYPEAPLNGGKLTQSTGLVSGWAKALVGGTAESGGWDGWIKLDGASAGVIASGEIACEWSGWAWGGGGDTGVLGWISFSYQNDHNEITAGIQPSGVNYGVKGKGDACTTGNLAPIAEAGISIDDSTYSTSINAIVSIPINIYLSADRDLDSSGQASYDPKDWSDLVNGVSTGGKCEWDLNFDGNFGGPLDKTINNPSNATACNVDLGSKTFSTTGGYVYKLKITDNQGLESNLSPVTVNVSAMALPNLVIQSINIPDDDTSTAIPDIKQGNSVVFSGVVKENNNVVVNDSFKVRFCVDSSNEAGCFNGTSGFKISDQDILSLSAGATVSSNSAPWIAAAVVGSHKLFICADVENTVPESSDTISDNCKKKNFKIYSTASPLAATCSGVVSGMSITWTATPSGGALPYTYLWSGDEVLSGVSRSVSKTYTSVAVKNAQVIVTDSATPTASQVTVSCSATPISTSINGVCGTTGVVSSMPLPGDLCSAGNPSPASLSGSSPWNWVCVGINGGTNSSTCNANLATGGGGGSSSSVGWGWIWRPR